ncbi:MFS transporter [Roseicella aquatilis]|uniref:MFS transporter n=1 Tax=Roseicella aquatilis TaxID=2527868 RepID=A0A4R4DRF1_9PROT|nr:MFS transporter [Roseicella aquatilis]TCZ64952.1 MFS transporter [Roseicella aquatilis]
MTAGPPGIAAPGWRYALAFAVYGYQGLVAGFALTALPNHYAAHGAPIAEIGWYTALLGLPWMVQPLWGPMVDRLGDFRMGRRRFWVVLAMAGALASLGLLLLLAGMAEPAPLPLIGQVMLVHGACASLLDTALDAMMIDRVPVAKLGRVNACTRAGFVSGTALGAILFAWLLPQSGLGTAAAVLLALGAGAAALPLLVRESGEDAWLSLRRRDRAPGAARPAGHAALLLAALRERGSLALIAYCVAQEFAGAMVGLRLSVAMVQGGGWTAPALSQLQGAATFVAGTAGALSVGWWADRAGPRRVLAILLGLCAAAHLAMAAVLHGTGGEAGGAGAAALVVLNTGLPALSFVALAPAVMDVSRGSAAATRFALFMAALNSGGVLGAMVAGRLGTAVSLPVIALAAGAIFAACAVLARSPLLFRRVASERSRGA